MIRACPLGPFWPADLTAAWASLTRRLISRDTVRWKGAAPNDGLSTAAAVRPHGIASVTF
jgi:hypothetical protein